jgi:uncharacterized protein YbjT (DUF2867 family)
MSTGRVTVFGATGTGGRAYVRAFRDAGFEVRGVVRPGGNAGVVRRLGAEPVEVDLSHPDHAAAVVEGADAVVVSLLGRGVNAVAEEAAITRSAFEAARRAGVGRVVYTSVHLADAHTGVPHFDIKAELERDLAATGLPWTVLRPTTFMEGLDAPFMRDAALESGVVVSAIEIDTPISYVATDDLARLAVLSLENARLDGAVIPIGGPPVTYRSLLPLLSAICGRELRFELLDVEFLEAEEPHLAEMFRFLNAHDFIAPPSPLVEAVGLELTDVETFLRRSGWARGSVAAD